MDDQNINKINGLSYEEELDVLDAVYKIGKEKGIELLRPDQMKKLADGGRIAKIDAGNSDTPSLADVVSKKLFERLDRFRLNEFSDNEWEMLSEKDKDDWRSEIFYKIYNKNYVDFQYDLNNKLSGVRI